MLELKHIFKKFEDRVILDDLSIILPDTGMIGIVGESGCGKSTLLYILGMLDRDYEGEIFFNGEIITHYDDFIRHHVSYMMQNNDMIESLTLKENILLPCQVSYKGYDASRFEKITKQLEIDTLLSRYPSQLSGGQLKRASIAKALLKQSSLVLADEPTGSLHLQQSHEVMHQLQKLSHSSLVIVVSHDPQLLKTYCDSILTLKDGKLKGRIVKMPPLAFQPIQTRYYSLLYYPIQQLLHQRNKLVFLFLFQWIVIVAFFLIVTAMNGVFDAISESEWQSVGVNMMSVEKRDGQFFDELLNDPLIYHADYESRLEQVSVYFKQQSLSCIVHYLPLQTQHIQLQEGRLPQSKDEIIISYPLYQTIHQNKSLQLTYQQQMMDMKVVGVLRNDFFAVEEIYCLPSLGEEWELTNKASLSIEAKSTHARELYQKLVKDYHVYSDVIERVDNYQSLLSLAQWIASLFIGVSFFISLLLIAIVESIIYLERQHDVAYLLSLGMSQKRLFSLSFMEALFMGMIMGVGGCLLSIFTYYYLNDVYQISQYFHMHLVLKKVMFHIYDLYGIIILSYMLMTMLGSLIPMKKMMQTSVIDVLREE